VDIYLELISFRIVLFVLFLLGFCLFVLFVFCMFFFLFKLVNNSKHRCVLQLGKKISIINIRFITTN